MILVRDVFQAKYDRGDELVALFKEANQWMGDYAARILTDASGTFFTIVTEQEFPSLGEWERINAEAFSDPRFGPWFEQMVPLVDSGQREFYNVVE